MTVSKLMLKRERERKYNPKIYSCYIQCQYGGMRTKQNCHSIFSHLIERMFPRTATALSMLMSIAFVNSAHGSANIRIYIKKEQTHMNDLKHPMLYPKQFVYEVKLLVSAVLYQYDHKSNEKSFYNLVNLTFDL